MFTAEDMIVIDEKFLVIKEINGYLVVMILINSFRSGYWVFHLSHLYLDRHSMGYDHVVLLLALIKLDSLIATLRSAISWKKLTQKNLTKFVSCI
jgi:hypothetical protein